MASSIAAAARRTDVDQIVLCGGGGGPFGNGINLNHVYAARAGIPAEAQANIRAINEVAQAMFRARRDGVSVIALLDGDAGAGGAFLPCARTWWSRCRAARSTTTTWAWAA